MSELIQAGREKGFLRGHLLSTVCGIALIAMGGSGASAEDAVRPTTWIELGGQLEHMSDSVETFAPPFVNSFDPSLFQPVLPFQGALRYSNGAEGKLLFQPSGSNWVFSAALRYGRANGRKANYQRLPEVGYHFEYVTGLPGYRFPGIAQHLNATVEDAERHMLVDFKAGKDVGLGMFGAHGTSLFSFGVRFAQFTAHRKTDINGVPDFFRSGTELKYQGIFRSHHLYAGSVDLARSFSGLGPSVSWDGSTPLGRGDDSEVTVDWGINGAVLFGRQKVKGQSNVTSSHYKSFSKIPKYGAYTIYHGVASGYHHVANVNRSRSVIVPNIGGFAGVSYRYSTAKLSLGYRADFFFGAMDGGIDARKTYDRNFYGPFATISIGLGG